MAVTMWTQYQAARRLVGRGVLAAEEHALLRRLAGVARLVKAGNIILEPHEQALLEQAAMREGREAC